MAEHQKMATKLTEQTWIDVGYISQAHGLKGHVILRPYNVGSELFVPGLSLRLVPKTGDAVISALQTVWDSKSGKVQKGFRVCIECIADRNQADLFRGAAVFVESDALPQLDDGEFYHVDLIGLKAVTAAGEALGLIEDVMDGAAHDVYVLRLEQGEELLVPAVGRYVVDVDVTKGHMIFQNIDELC